MPRRRVLFVQPNSEVGGSDLALLRFVEALDRTRYEPVVLLPKEGPLAPRLRAAGAALHLVPMMQLRTLPSPGYQARYLARIWPTVRAIARLIREERIDFVHSNSLYCLYGAFAARVAKVPHLWHVREIPPNIPVARPALARMVLSLSDIVLCMTRACTDGLFGPGPEHAKIRYLSEGLDLGTWSREHVHRSIRDELGIAAGTPVVGFVARLDPWKGLDVFLDAAAQVRQRVPEAVFLVSGDAPAGFEPYRDAMQERARSLGLGESVRFLGWRYRMDDIPALMASLDVFCHTSSSQPEPFGLVIIEAMSMGCAAIAARAGGPMEIIRDGVSGLLTPPRDARALAEAVTSLLTDPEKRRAIAAGGRARVEEEYSLPAFRRSIAALYAQMPGGAGDGAVGGAARAA
ncbi:glycosyltransferase family 4 protein [Roseomonas sp. OT10]|uniref:glycosyltransferase family 4 protein n=1 Tax=Roseomonas cutis TaxID=2897332 RepID=UPI001E2D6277|nr:glycosyltransferase family 4 protein [Roseomonas sp. OT10]UFN49755.1 glycosyltransferase family 4 protein [Roseomonas sp. OT10]